MKRFYKLVSTASGAGGFSVQLDGRSVKTPAGNILQTTHEKLANALVLEWAGQGEHILPDTMPLTQLLSTRIDRIATMREEISRQTLNYLDTDLLCYRAEKPPGLPERQAQSWDPWLQWFEKQFGVSLKTTTELQALQQDRAAHEKVAAYVKGLGDDPFNVLQLVTSVSGSLILALAFVKGEMDTQTLFDAFHVEEHFKAEIYNEALHGQDPAQEKKDKALLRDLSAAHEYLGLTK